MDSHCAICGTYLADTGRMVCEKCEKPKKEVLKPCPFCGGEAECYRTVIKTNLGYSDAVAVRCIACGARTGYVLFDGRKHPNGEEYEESEHLWNRRAEDG